MSDSLRSDGGAGLRFGGARDGLASMMSASARPVLKPSTGPDLPTMVAALHEAMINSLDSDKLAAAAPGEARKLVEETIATLIATGDYPVYGEVRQRLVSLVADEVLGLGPIQALVDDSSVTEVMVNAPDQVYFERDGVIHPSDITFRDDGHVRRVAERILSQIGRRVDEGTPMVDARLNDGSRVNITIPPATPVHSTITIRKFRRDRYRIEDLIAAKTLDEKMAEFLGACTTYKLNILISGGTGSGKTTFLNALSAYIPRSERIVTIEDPVELALQQRHVIKMEARPPDMTGAHAIAQRDLLRNALRMRPDRIIIGEIRGAEAFEIFLVAGRGDRRERPAVEGAVEGDDLIALWPSGNGLILPRHLDRAFHRFRAGVLEKGGVGEGVFDQAFREPLALGDLVEVRDVPELLGLLGDGFHQRRVGMAERIHGNAGTEIEILFAVGRGQPSTFAALETHIGACVGRQYGRDHGMRLLGSLGFGP